MLGRFLRGDAAMPFGSNGGLRWPLAACALLLPCGESDVKSQVLLKFEENKKMRA